MERPTLSLTLICVLLIAALIALTEAKGFRGGGGFRGGNRGFRGSTRGSSWGGKGGFFRSRSGYSMRNIGYGTYRTRRVPPPRTSLYTRHHGLIRSPYTRRSSSFNGFGLGLGVGMLVGFRLGGLSRPIGYSSPGYGYSYIHQHRDYRLTRPFQCAKVNVSEYLKKTFDSQEINIEERDMECDNVDDVCFGLIDITAANFTADNDTVYEGFSVRIEKGCSAKERFDQDFTLAAYDASRKCWLSDLEKSVLGNLSDATTSLAEDTNDTLTILMESMGLKDKEITSVSIRRQSQACICDGWFCNSAPSTRLQLSLFVSFLFAHLLSVIN